MYCICIVYCATLWVSPDTRPLWTYINHSTRRPNCHPAIPAARAAGCDVAFVSLVDIDAGAEILFNYGGFTADFDGGGAGVSSSIDVANVMPGGRRRRPFSPSPPDALPADAPPQSPAPPPPPPPAPYRLA